MNNLKQILEAKKAKEERDKIKITYEIQPIKKGVIWDVILKCPESGIRLQYYLHHLVTDPTQGNNSYFVSRLPVLSLKQYEDCYDSNIRDNLSPADIIEDFIMDKVIKVEDGRGELVSE